MAHLLSPDDTQMSRPPVLRTPNDVFPLLELVGSMPGVLQEHLVPALQDRHKAALAVTCTKLRELVQRTVQTLNLHAGRCCLVHVDQLSPKLPNIAALSLKPGNLHEAMYVLPIFFMQDACRMSGITSLQLLDQLPDRPPDRIQCGSCLAFTSTYDLSAILVTAGTCMPRIAALDFATHYISDAECAAIALMTGLTRLQLRSTHGTKSSGLARFTSLKKLADLRLLDSNLDRTSHAGDMAMLLGRSCLTHLEIRYHPILVPAMLSALVEMQDLVNESAVVLGVSPGSSRRASLASSSNPTPAATSWASAGSNLLSPTAAGASCTATMPPPLRSLSLVLSPYMSAASSAVQHIAKLTNLRSLSLGWYARMGHLAAGEAADEVIPPAVQKQLSQLVGLQHLAIGWPLGHEVLGALAAITGLTSLHLGRLPPKQPPPGLQLPSVRRFTLHMRQVLSPGNEVPNWVAEHHRDLVAGLAAFPQLTALELTGDIPAHTLAHLPTVLPASLQELQLAQRMASPTRQDLAKLRMLTGLTSLRIGWRATMHDGPPSLPGWEEEPLDIDVAEVAADVAAAAALNRLSTFGANDIGGNNINMQQSPGTISLAALTQLKRLDPPAKLHPGEVTPQTMVNLFASASETAFGVALDGKVLTAEAAGEQLPAVAAAAERDCELCGPSFRFGCLCRLQRLELVGPVTGSELMHLTGLTSLRTILLRDNSAWSSGLPCDNLAKLIVRCSSIQRLELVSCPGVDGLTLERFVHTLDPLRLSSVDIVARGGGRSAIELGWGYQFIGDVLSPAQEKGDEETMWWGGVKGDPDQLPEGVVAIGPQPNPIPQLYDQDQIQSTLMQVHDLVGQLQQLNNMLANNPGMLQNAHQLALDPQAQAVNENVQALPALLPLVQGMMQQMQQLGDHLHEVAAFGGLMQAQLQDLGAHLQQAAGAAAPVAAVPAQVDLLADPAVVAVDEAADHAAAVVDEVVEVDMDEGWVLGMDVEALL